MTQVSGVPDIILSRYVRMGSRQSSYHVNELQLAIIGNNRSSGTNYDQLKRIIKKTNSAAINQRMPDGCTGSLDLALRHLDREATEFFSLIKLLLRRGANPHQIAKDSQEIIDKDPLLKDLFRKHRKRWVTIDERVIMNLFHATKPNT